ncbi:hypothetical protein TNCV_2762771 [Trichonephila clavipes]|nr:hypothetical protein TNCV_2762771 [Trichonephila clavipes]
MKKTEVNHNAVDKGLNGKGSRPLLDFTGVNECNLSCESEQEIPFLSQSTAQEIFYDFYDYDTFDDGLPVFPTEVEEIAD